MTSRSELFQQLGIVRPGPSLDPFTERAYNQHEWDKFNKEDQRLITSFWGGAFPAGPGLHCGRKAIYELMNLPKDSPRLDPKGVAVTGMGSAAEEQIVYRWGRAGLTIGGSVQLEEHLPFQQLRLQDPSVWLSASLDAVLDLRPEWNSVFPVDIKSKSDVAIDEMGMGQRSYDPQHWAQVLCYIGLCRKFHNDMGWQDLGLAKAEGGMIYYVSRENPRKTFEYYVEWNEKEYEAAIQLLSSWRASFLNGEIPQRDKGWKWSAPPCQWCPWKKEVCKPDVKDEVIQYQKSNAVPGTHDLLKVKEMIEKRWK